MPRKPTWRCTKVTNKVPCEHENPNRFQICQGCGKKRAPRKKPAHMDALDKKKYPYEWYVEVFGERCGMCEAGPGERGRLFREHDHKTGLPRGLACWPCNNKIARIPNVGEARQVVVFLERAEQIQRELGLL